MCAVARAEKPPASPSPGSYAARAGTTPGRRHRLSEHLVGVAPFVVVPAHDLDQIPVNDPRELEVDNGRARIADDVRRNQRVVRDALESMRARGAFVEQIVVRSGELPDVVVCATAGTGVPPLGSKCQLHGSYTERVTTSGEPALIADLAQRERSGT